MPDNEVEFPWFPMWAVDFVNSRKVRVMTPEEVGVYILLLCHQWNDGPLPDDERELSVLANGADANTVEAVLERVFARTEDGWVNERLELVREEQEEKREQKVRAGKASAKARRRKKIERRSNGASTVLERSTNESESDTETDVTTTEDKSSGAGAPVQDDSVGDVFAPLIRQHCWLGSDPPPKTVENNPGWHMGRELTIARQLIERGDVTAIGLARIIETHREALEVEPTRPTSLLMFNMKDRKQYLSVCQGHIDKTAGSAATMGEALRNLKLAS